MLTFVGRIIFPSGVWRGAGARNSDYKWAVGRSNPNIVMIDHIHDAWFDNEKRCVYNFAMDCYGRLCIAARSSTRW